MKKYSYLVINDTKSGKTQTLNVFSVKDAKQKIDDILNIIKRHKNYKLVSCNTSYDRKFIFCRYYDIQNKQHYFLTINELINAEGVSFANLNVV